MAASRHHCCCSCELTCKLVDMRCRGGLPRCMLTDAVSPDMPDPAFGLYAFMLGSFFLSVFLNT